MYQSYKHNLLVRGSSPRWEKWTSGYHNYPLKGLNFWYMYWSQKYIFFKSPSHLPPNPKCVHGVCMLLDIPCIQENRTYFTLTQIKYCHGEYDFKTMSLKHRAPWTFRWPKLKRTYIIPIMGTHFHRLLCSWQKRWIVYSANILCMSFKPQIHIFTME